MLPAATSPAIIDVPYRSHATVEDRIRTSKALGEASRQPSAGAVRSYLNCGRPESTI
ncbi:MAG: hypothetical protein ACRDNZ_12755 [Streptosporangiaceae bacterium]